MNWAGLVLATLLWSSGGAVGENVSDAAVRSEGHVAAPGTAEASVQAEPQVEVDAPVVALSDVPVRLTLRVPEGGSRIEYRLLTATGRELASGRLAAGAEEQLDELSLEGRDDLPLRLEYGTPGAPIVTRSGQSIELKWLPGWVSLLPPLIAIVLAIALKEVVASLFFGVWLGALFFAGLNPLAALWRTIDRFIVPALADADHVSILVFSLLLGGMVGLMSRTAGPGASSRRWRRSPPTRARASSPPGWPAGDLLRRLRQHPARRQHDAAHHRPAADLAGEAGLHRRLHGGPGGGIVLVSTWVGYEISLIGDALAIAAEQPGVAPRWPRIYERQPVHRLPPLHPVPLLPILAIVMVGLLGGHSAGLRPDARRRAPGAARRGLYRDGASLLADTTDQTMEPKEGVPGRWYNAAVPVADRDRRGRPRPLLRRPGVGSARARCGTC